MTGIHAVTVPKWGIEMQEGTLVAWRLQPGETVAKGAELADIETEKIVNTLESPRAGVLRRQIAAEGDTLAVGALVAVLSDGDASDEDIDSFVANFEPVDASFEPDTASPLDLQSPPAPATASAAAGAVRVNPVVRRLAEKLGVDLGAVSGSGRNGRITKQDIERAASGAGPAASASASASEQADSEALTSMRKTIARRLQQSMQELPHYYLRMDVNVDALLALRDQREGAGINDFLLRAAALALQQVPALNVHFDGEGIRRFSDSDIALAVATDTGLITPVVRAAQNKTVTAIAAEARELAARARAGELQRAEIEGATFTVSNLGKFGVTDFTAIINPPQVAILAAGAAEQRAVASNGEVAAATIMTLTLSCDHRVIDGAVAARFLSALKQLIEEPERL
ncbi:MAG: dihydrolipoamide acetyltransferase family protein [Chromatiales bacterium]